MMKLRKYIDEIKPQFEPGGKFSALQSLFAKSSWNYLAPA